MTTPTTAWVEGFRRTDGAIHTQARAVAEVATAHRTTVTAADVCAAVGTITCTIQTGGSLTDGTYTIYVAAGNVYGRGVPVAGNTTVTSATTNDTARALFAAVTGATYFDIYCSTDGAASKWVGRITEAQRASGILITAVGTTGVGGTAGGVDIQVVGTGIAANAASNVASTAFIVPTAVDSSGYQYIDFDFVMSRTGDAVVPSLTYIPFYYNARAATYAAGAPAALTFGGASGVYNPLQQRVRLTTNGNSGVAIAVAAIAGTGASLNVDATLS